MYKKRGKEKNYHNFFAQRKFLVAVTTLIGTVVGAGVLGIPYVVSRTGFVYGMLLMVVIGLALVFLNLFIGEIVLRTREQHQLTGYAGKYLGPVGKHIMMFTMVLSIYGALTAYIIGEGETLRAIFGFGSAHVYMLLFFVACLVIVAKGVKAAGSAEMFLIGLLFLVIVLIGVFSFDYIEPSYFAFRNFSNFFLPYGVVLFAFMAAPAIPELQEELGDQRRKMKKVIIVGSLIPIVLYLVFTGIVLGIVGPGNFEALTPNERIATVALSLYSHPILGTLANVLAVLAMFTSFLTLALALVEIYHLDYHFSRRAALVATFLVPLAIALLNITTFIAVLAVTGALAGGLEGIMMVLTFWKARKLGNRKPEYSMGPQRLIGGLLILMFIVGILYQLQANFM